MLFVIENAKEENMKKFVLSYKSKQWNEDFAYVCDDYGFVLDGATAVTSQKFSNLDSDAEWYSKTMGNFLINNLEDKSKSIFEIVRSGIKSIKKEYKKLSKGSEVIDFPSSTLSLARIIGENVEFYTISDSIILVEDIFGNVFEVFDSRNAINDSIRMSYIQGKVYNEKLTILEARQKYPDIIFDGRKLRNTIGHQYVLADDEDAADEGIAFSMEKKFIKKIVILSDGFSQCFDLFKFVSPEEFVKKINCEKDAIKMYEKLVKMQNKDFDCKKFLRFKKTDDASLVCMNF